jgi:2-polyprenyl-3-methyl-5-hydroxy-6-metoxy-1,4-benzoquinol methylase
MDIIPFQRFDDIFQDSVHAVYKYWTPQMQNEIAAHCYSWRAEQFDFKKYLQASSIRYYHAYLALSEIGNVTSVCDVGGFWGAWPLTLKSMGYKVTMTESLEYYSNTFSALFNYISDKGVNVIDYDPFQPGKRPYDRFDFISVMAVLEHYPHSLKSFMDNVTSLLNNDGRLYIEVPNIAYWPKRVNFLFGRTPLAQLKEIFHSEIPFIGHHHEFTMAELKDLVKLSNMEIIREVQFNYSQQDNFMKSLLRHPLETIAFFVAPYTRECISVVCKKER